MNIIQFNQVNGTAIENSDLYKSIKHNKDKLLVKYED